MIHATIYAAFFAFGLVALVSLKVERDRARLLLAAFGLSGTALLIFASLFSMGILFDSDAYLGDLWTAFEAINKANDGLRSSTDYFSAIGPFQDWIYSIAVALRPFSAATVPMAGGLVALIAAALGALMLFRKTSALGLSLALFVACATAVSPREIDAFFTDPQLNYLAPYNRWAWALFVPVAIRLALPSTSHDLPGATALGIAIGCLLLLKVTYGAAALGLLALAVLLRTETPRETIASLVAIVSVLVVSEIATGQTLAHLRDLATVAQLDSGLRLSKLYIQSGEMAFAWAVALLTLLILRRDWAEPPQDELFRPLMMILAVGGAGNAVLMQNHYTSEAAVYSILPLIAAEWAGALRMCPIAAPRDVRIRSLETSEAALLIAVVFVALRPALIDAGTVLGQQVQLLRKPGDAQLAGTAISNLWVDPEHIGRRGSDCHNGTCAHYRAMISGRDLLVTAGADRPEAGAVLTLGFSNPFPTMLGKSSPLGTPIWLARGRTFSDDHHVPPEEFFAGVQFVMIADTPNSRPLKQIYGDYLSRHFSPTGSNTTWQLLEASPTAKVGSAVPEK